jgi:ribosomal protein S9
VAAGIQYYGTGRRKTSTARVFLRPGTGGIVINRKPIEQAFPTEALRTQIKQPLSVTETADKFDVLATIAGGGIAGQAGALRLGIARARRVQHRAPAAAQEGRFPDARRADQGAQEIRTEGGAQALSVQ